MSPSKNDSFISPMNRQGFSLSMPTLAFAALHLVLVVGALVPYLLRNPIAQWDAPGHLFSAWYAREYLFPKPTGWNPYFFGGFPQGTLYPFLFHYLVAGLAFLMPLATSFKAVVATAVAATPLSFYFACRGFALSPTQATAGAIWMTALLALPIEFATDNNHVGGTLASTFRIGLVANAFALPLLFFYVGALLRSIRSRHMLLPTLLLAALVLSHLMTALVGLLFMVFLAAAHLRERPVLVHLLRHGAVAFLLVAFWAIPFLSYSGYSDSIRLQLYLGRGAFALIGCGLLAVAWLHSRRTLENNLELSAWFLTLVVAVLLSSSLPVRLHFYRFVLYPVLLVPVLLIKTLPHRHVNSICTAGLACLVLSVVAPPPGGLSDAFSGTPVAPPFIVEHPVRGRTLILANSAEQPSSSYVHQLQHSLPMYLRCASSKGLFVESSLNARYFLSLEKLMDPWAMIWGVPTPDLSGLASSRRQGMINHNLERLGITSVITARAPNGLTYTSRAPIMMSDAPAAFRVVYVNGVPERVRAWHEKRYASISSESVVLVDDEVEGGRYSVFRGVNLDDADRAVLNAGAYTYFVERAQAEVWNVDFLLPRNRDKGSETMAVQKLRAQVDALADSIPLKQALQMTLGDVEDELYQVSSLFATRRYSGDPVVNLDPVAEYAVPADSDRVEEGVLGLPFSIFTLPDTQLVTIVNRGSRVVTQAWDKFVMSWFLSPVLEDFILAPFDGSVTGAGTVRNVRANKTMERIQFHIDSSEPTLVKVKVSYFPKWRAWVNGQRTPIYRITPNFMAVMARGDVELRYGDTLADVIGGLLSLLGCILLLFFVARERRASMTLEPSAHADIADRSFPLDS